MNQIVFHSNNTYSSPVNQKLPIPEAVGEGVMETILCSSGIRVVLTDIELRKTGIIKNYNVKSSFGFGFCLSGAIEVQPSCMKKGFLVKGGQSGFFNFPEQDNFRETISAGVVRRVNIFISPDLLFNFLGKNAEKMLSRLTGSKESPYRISDITTLPMQVAFNQIFNCTYQGPSRQLYIEGKVLELIAHKIEQMAAHSKSATRTKKLTSDEIERVWHAAELLTTDLENPPSIAELSSRVGMCRSKLFICFQEVFGMPPFGYLHQKRMETAGHLLEAGEINVTQAAYAVGYSSLSHFAKAFKRHFGVLPGKRLETISSIPS